MADGFANWGVAPGAGTDSSAASPRLAGGFQSLCLALVMSLPVVCGGLSYRARVRSRVLGVSSGRGPSPVLEGLLLVLLQGSTDGILHQPLADPQELRLVGLRAATPTCEKTSHINEDIPKETSGKHGCD